MMNESSTYQELLTAYKQLLVENEQLRRENARLIKLSDSLAKAEKETENRTVISDCTDSNPVHLKKQFIALQCLSLEEKVILFCSLFKGREDVFARRWYSKVSQKFGYQPVCLNEWNTQLCNKKKFKCAKCPNRQFKRLEYEDIYKHLEGKNAEGCDVIGAYVVLVDNHCHFLCVDFDDK